MNTLEKANQYIKEQPEDHSRPLFHVTAPTGWIFIFILPALSL